MANRKFNSFKPYKKRRRRRSYKNKSPLAVLVVLIPAYFLIKEKGLFDIKAQDLITGALFSIIFLVLVFLGINYVNQLIQKRKMNNAFKNYNLSGRLQDLDWREFEFLVGKLLTNHGYAVEVTRGSQDGGVDLFAKNKDGTRVVIQCKHWNKTNVGVSTVRELVGTMHLNNATKGIIANSGRFTKAAIEEAEKLGLVLLDGKEIMRLAQKG